MILPSLPFDYVKLVDPGDRVRTARARTTGRRVPRADSRREA